MDGPPPQEEDFSSLPISERIVHKNWKARVNAYESLIKTFQNTASDSDPAFKPYINNPDLLKKIATDSNAVAQEKGVECLVALVKFAGESAAKTRETVVPALVDKCFGSARAGTKNQAIELALQYIEVENSGAGVVADIVPGLGAKQPKAVAAGVLALKEIVKNFGTQVIPPAPVLKSLPKIFAHADKTVRAEGVQLTHTLYQYIGPAIEPWLADLKPVQVKELQEAFEGLEKEGKGKGSLKAERITREHARVAEMNQGVDDAPENAEADAELDLPDPRTLAEAVDIVPRLPSNFQTNIVSSKWKERKEALDDLLTLLNATPRIKEAPELGELAKSLAVCIQKDANINCVIVAAGCLDGLAKGMMSSFARMRELVVPPMLERLKERKANVTDAIGAALDAVFSTTTLPDIIPDILPALANKNPQVKEGTLKFLGRSLSTSPIAIQPNQIKLLTDPLATLLEDGFEGARNEAATCLGTLMKMVGERPLNALMDGLADVRKAKVKEAYEKASVKAKAGAGSPPKPPPAASKEAPAKKKAPSAKPPPAETPAAETPADLKLEQEPPKKKPPARLMQKKAPAAAGGTASPAPGAPPTAPAAKKPVPAAATAKAGKGGAPAAPGALDTFKYKHTPEDADGLAADLIPGTIMSGLGDSNWKARLAACEEMMTWLEGVVDDIEAEVVIRALAKKGWVEKNFQVSAKLYGILSLLAERCPTFGRSCVALCTGHLSEKLGDMKLKKPAGDALLIFSEQTSLQFVLNQAYEPLGKQKAPKVLADALVWVDLAITEFGIVGLSLRNLIDFLKNALKNSNAAVRTSATKTLVTVKLFAGSSIKDLLEDLNPQLLVTIQSEFDKVEGAPAPEPVRTSADVAAMAPAAVGGSSKGALADPLDDLYPRVEIDGLLKGTTILADAKSDAWKAKKEALETLQAILDQGANKRLKPTMGEIGQALKNRVIDTNKAVQMLALDIVARIATGMGKPFEKQTKFFVVPVATALSDQKAPIRSAALQTLTAIATACESIDPMVHFLTTGIESTNPTQRATLLGWIADYFKDHPPSSTLDLSGWASIIVGCLDDRSADVRKGAQAILPALITSVGFDRVMQQTNALKPASRKTAAPLIQAARESATPAAEPAPAKPLAKAAPTASAPSPPPQADNPPSPPSPSPATNGHSIPSSKLTGVRRKLPQGTNPRPESRTESLDEPPPARPSTKPGLTGLKRPAVNSASAKVPASGHKVPAMVAALPFSSMNMEAKRSRLSKDAQRWINEAGPTRKDLAEALQHQMEPHTSKDVVTLLFSHDHNAVSDHVSGLTMIYDFFSAAESSDDKFGVSPDDLRAVGLASFDLALKYVSIKAHEPQSNLITRCLDVVEVIVTFLRSADAHLEDAEAVCFVPTLVYKLGDAREPVRARVQHIVQSLPKVYAFSRIFDMLVEYGLKSKVAKTRQGALDELASLLKRNGMSACNQPSKTFPAIAAMIADKDSQVRKSALSVLSEAYSLVGEKVWSLVGTLSAKDKTQLEERLRRVAGPSSPGNAANSAPAPPAQVTRLAMPSVRPGSPATLSKTNGAFRPGSPVVSVASRIARPSSPARAARSGSPAPSNMVRSASPSRISKLPGPSGIAAPSSVATPSSPSGIGRPKTLLPSRLQPRTKPKYGMPTSTVAQLAPEPEYGSPPPHVDNHPIVESASVPSTASTDDNDTLVDSAPPYGSDGITVTISSILSSDPLRSVDALKKIQKILVTKPEDGHLSEEYRELAEHTEGLIETITLQMAHVFDRPDDLVVDENFRLAKHLIQTLNTFCDHSLLAESLTVDILTPLLEELTMRLLETDESHVTKVKDLSRFINMIILRLFATGRRMSIFRALFALLLQIVKPFPSNGTLPESKQARVAELVLKCVWKLARNIPQDLKEEKLDPVELLPAVEHFLQSVPPNEWRARATNKVPCGDMPLRTIKVIIQHVVAHYGDEVYDFLSASFDDPSATIVYPYVYRILNSSARAAESAIQPTNSPPETIGRPYSAASSRPISPQSMTSGNQRHSSPSHRTSPSVSSHNGNGFAPPPVEEPDPEAQLLTIINHISSETTGAMHKEGITELHQFLKNYPHKRPRVEKLLESTGPAFRKYINRALASRAAEDLERNVAVASTLSKLESNAPDSVPSSPVTRTELSPRSPQHQGLDPPPDERLQKFHDLFQYTGKRGSVTSNSSSQAAGRPRISEGPHE